MLRMTGILSLALLAGAMGCNSATPDTKAQDTADIKALEDHFAAAVKAKDVNGIMAEYVPDQSLLVFDLGPPRQYVGADAYRKDWQEGVHDQRSGRYGGRGYRVQPQHPTHFSDRQEWQTG